jgi:hypothetical protein
MATQEVTVTPTVQSVSIASGIPQQAIDPTREMFLYSDFIADISPFGSSTGTAANASSGIITFENSTSGASIFGYANLRTNGTQGSRCGVFAAYGTTTDVQRRTLVGSGAYDFTARVLFSNASATTQRVIVGLGLSHGPAGANMLQYGAAFVAYGNAANWIATTAENNVLSELDTGKSSGAWRTLRLTINAAGDEYKFYIDGELVRTVTGTPFDPLIQLAWGVELRDKAVGGTLTDADVLIDFMALKYTIAR